MATVISVINYKGGVGKTTITLELGIGLANILKKRVLLVDLDPQCSLSLATVDEHYWIDWIERRGSIRDVVRSFYDEDKARLDPEWIIENALDRAWDSMPGISPGLDLLPSHLDLPDYEMRLVARKPKSIDSMDEFHLKRYLVLREAMAHIKKNYDYILFDCPPNIYMIARNAIIASDYFLVPTIPDFISCYGIPFILKHIENMQEEVRERGHKTNAQFLGIVRNRVRQVGRSLVREHADQSEKLRQIYGDQLLESMVMDRIAVAEILGTRKNIYTDDNPRLEEIREDFKRLTHEVLQRMK